MFVKLCDLAALKVGTMLPVGIGYTLVLAVWPVGGTPRVLQGICPHAGELLIDARFDGHALVCRAHDWVFDAASGACTHGSPCTLAAYPIQLRDDACSWMWRVSRPIACVPEGIHQQDPSGAGGRRRRARAGTDLPAATRVT